MAAKRDYYEILSVTKEADLGSIKASYKKLAIKFHPDKNPGDKEAEEKFKEAAEAYGILCDEKKRAQYDRFGHAGVQGGGGGGAEGFSNFEDIFSAFGDIFGGNFGGRGGGGRGRSGPPRGQDLQISLTVTLPDVSNGVTKKVKLKRYNKCGSCAGQGGTGKQVCNVCAGQGQVRQVQSSFFGQIVNVTTCPECQGIGQLIKNKCANCHGGGRIQEEVTLSIDVPPGVEETNYLTLRGEGHAGPQGGPSGDLIVAIKEAEDDFFERRGVDLYSQVELPYTTVALGGDIRVRTIDGEVDLKIPAGTQSEKLMRLKNKGLPDINGNQRGSQYVKLHVHTPENLSVREIEVLKELEKVQEKDHPKSFFQKAKTFFT
ncbi:MAG: molecular chaperone DnaJ [Fibrobacteria bacterium]